MDFEIEIMTQAERSYCYTGSQQLDKQTGCIGHLRGDMDRSGKGFFTSWEDHCGELKTQAFKDEFDDFINALRFDERYDGIFKNRSSLSRYCYEHKESVFAEDFIPQYGFRVDTPEYAYLLRLNPMQGDYNLYIYCYRREALDRHLKNAERGICFVNPQGKTLFHIPDGDSIRVIRPDGTQRDHACRYIDDHRAEIGSGHLYGAVCPADGADGQHLRAASLVTPEAVLLTPAGYRKCGDPETGRNRLLQDGHSPHLKGGSPCAGGGI